MGVEYVAAGPRALTPRRWRAFTLIELLVVVTIIGMLTALLLPAIQAARESARQSTCRNHLRQLALALNSYHAQHREFPEGARMHKRAGSQSIGWHVLILPHIEQNALYQEIQPDTDGGARLLAANRAVPLFFCPSSEPPSESGDDLEQASYVGVAGAGRTKDEWPVEEQICGIAATDGVLHLRSHVSVADIGDGSSHTLAIGERSLLNPYEQWTLGATWYAPGASKTPAQMCVYAAKQIVWPINALEARRIHWVRDYNGPAELRKVRTNELAFGSKHGSGAHFAYADGSVHFLDESIDLNLLRDLATRQGEEVASAAP